jgi:hypothetical protein
MAASVPCFGEVGFDKIHRNSKATRSPGDAIPGEAVGVAKTVEALVMRTDGFAQGRPAIDISGESLRKNGMIAQHDSLALGQALGVGAERAKQFARNADQAEVA